MTSPSLGFARVVLRALSVTRDQHDELCDDTEERYRLLQARSGRLVAEVRTVAAVVRLVPFLAPDAIRHRARRPRSTGGARLELLQVIRGLRRSSGVASLIVVTLGLGTAAVTVVFSVFDNILPKHAASVPRPDEIVNVTFDRVEILPRISVPHFDELAREMGDDVALASYYNAPVHVSRARQSTERLDVELVTARYFDVMRVRPEAGRTLSAADFAPGAPPVVVVGRSLANRYFGDESPVGHTILLNGHPFEIVGILPHDYRGAWNSMESEIWTALEQVRVILPALSTKSLDAHVFYHILGRLSIDGSLEPIQRRFQFHLDRMTVRDSSRAPHLHEARDGLVVTRGAWMARYYLEPIQRLHRTLSAGALLVFAVATLNAGILLLLRSFRRQRDAAIRIAVGAGAGSTLRIAILESLLLSLTGGGLALLLTAWTLDALGGIQLLNVSQSLDALTMRASVFVVALGAVVASGIAAGAAPAFLNLRSSASGLLRSGSVIGGHGSRLTMASAVLQVALLAPIVMSASLLLRTLSRIEAIDFGVRTTGLFTGELDVFAYSLGEERTRAAYRGLVDNLRGPGARHAAMSWVPEMSGRRPIVRVTTAASADTAAAIELAANQVSEGYFETLGIGMLSGRDFASSEVFRARDGDAGVAIVNRAAAMRLWADANVVGNLLYAGSPRRVLTVVGVVGDARSVSPLRAPEPFIWEPISQRGFTSPQVAIHVTMPGASKDAARTAMQAAVATMLPDVPVHNVASHVERAERHFITRISLARTALGLAVVSLGLAGIGLFGVIGHAVSSRRRELALRVALGAQLTRISGHVLRYVVVIAGIGVALGVPGSIVAARAMREQLYEVGAFDPVSLLLTLGAITGLALVAAAVPLRRATTVPAVEVLRDG
jgi:predicted permease